MNHSSKPIIIFTTLLFGMRLVTAYRGLPSRIFGSTSSLYSAVFSSVSANTLSSTDKLTKLREVMTKEGLDAFIIPTEDPHMSEYVASCYGRREFISGFTGSAGTAVVTLSKALLWADGRY